MPPMENPLISIDNSELLVEMENNESNTGPIKPNKANQGKKIINPNPAIILRSTKVSSVPTIK
jgi:hypothetical protein